MSSKSGHESDLKIKNSNVVKNVKRRLRIISYTVFKHSFRAKELFLPLSQAFCSNWNEKEIRYETKIGNRKARSVRKTFIGFNYKFVRHSLS